MKDKPLPHDLDLLVDAIYALPARERSTLLPLMDSVVDSTKRRQRVLTLVGDALEQVRMDMKYLIFDLEATRRERDKLLK